LVIELSGNLMSIYRSLSYFTCVWHSYSWQND